MTLAFIILFTVQGQAGMVAMYGGTSEESCKAKARQTISDIKRGTELMGIPYQPIAFRCHRPGEGKQ